MPNDQNKISKPISILVGYQWIQNGEKNSTWPFIRSQFETTMDSFAGSKKNTQKSGSHIRYTLGRMRGHHGSDVCAALIKRCQETDILAFDITTRNPNVMFELGIAIGARGVSSGAVFIFEEKKAGAEENNTHQTPAGIPSDLNGYFITYYTKKATTFRLVDPQGSKAAVIYKAKCLARERGMLIEDNKYIEIN
jgi:hypothetical protein